MKSVEPLPPVFGLQPAIITTNTNAAINFRIGNKNANSVYKFDEQALNNELKNPQRVITYLLAALDILTAAVLLLHVNFGMFPLPVVLVHGIYLGTKGLLFARGDFASKIDLACSIYIIIVAFGLAVNTAVTWAVAIWLLQKAGLALLPMR